jgi:hypothetical protein
MKNWEENIKSNQVSCLIYLQGVSVWRILRVANLVVLFLIISIFAFVPKSNAAIGYRASTTGTINSSSVLTINIPAGTSQNDVMVAAITVNTGGPIVPTFTPPSGWTQIQTSTNRSGSYYPATAMFYKIAGASEPGSYSWNVSSNAYGGGWIASFTGVNTSNPIDTYNIQTVGSSSSQTTNYATPSITLSNSNEMVVMTYGGITTGSRDTWTAPSGTSTISTSVWVSGGRSSSSGFYVLQASSGATGSFSSVASLNSYGSSGIIALNVGSAPPTVNTPTKTALGGSTITLGGNIASNGGASITGAGVCVGTSANPSVGGTCFTTGTTSGVFTVNATGLSTSTTYHYRAYATNSAGTSYSSDDTFTTTSNANYYLYGDNTVYSGVGSAGFSMRLLRVYVPTAGFLNSISPCFGVNSGTSTIYAGLYSDSSGSPGSLLTGPVSTTDSTTSNQFISISTSPIYLTSGYYWIGESSSDPFDEVCNGGSGSYYLYNLGGNAGNWPSTISGATTSSYALGAYLILDTTPRPIGVSANTTTNVNSYYVTLNGSANPNGATSTGHFRIFTTQPSNCNSDSGGSRVPVSSANDVSLGSSSTSQNFSYTTSFENPGYLTPQTQYWVCSYGVYTSTSQTTGSSTVGTFTTPDGPANPCDAPTSDNLIIPASASCSFSGTGYTGVSSTSSITFSAGSVMTANPGQTIARGSSMVFSGGTLTLGGGSLVRGGVYAKDADGDGVVDNSPITDGYVGTSPPAGYVAWSTLGGSYNYDRKVRAISTYDCNSSNANVYQTVSSLVTDADHDGYQTSAAAASQCVGSSTTVNGRTYYKDTSGNYTWLPSSSELGSPDCDDTNSASTILATYYKDNDGDGHGSVSTIQYKGGNEGTGSDYINSTSSLSLSKPSAGIQSGVFMVASIAFTGGSSITITPPTGWTLINRGDNAPGGFGTSSSVAMYYKMATSSEPTSYTWTASSSVRYAGNIVAYDNVNTASPIDTSASSSNNTYSAQSNSYASGSITTSNNNELIITAFESPESPTWTPPSGMTERSEDTDNNNYISLETSDVMQTTAGAVGTKTALSNTSGYGAGVIVALQSDYVAPQTTCFNPGAGWTTNDGTDCNDSSSSLYQNLTAYTDKDGDGYGVTPTFNVCSGSSLPSGYVTNSTDCYDSNSNAHPGQTSYFSTTRGDSSYDYDCDGSTTRDPGYNGYDTIYGYSGVSACNLSYKIPSGTCYTVNPSCTSGTVSMGSPNGTVGSTSACGSYVSLPLYSGSTCTNPYGSDIYLGILGCK